MDGTALVDFPDFVMATKPHKISPTTDILNDTAKQYYLLGDMIKGRGDQEIVQNGQYVQDMVRLAKHNAAGYYRPNQSLQPRGMDVLTTIKAHWRFHQGNYAWADEQVKLNGAGNMDNWVRLLTAWRQATYQDIWDSREENLLGVADNDSMEAEDGLVPYSLLAFITSDGLAPSGFTTVMGVNPTSQTNWRNQTDAYTAASLSTTLYPAFDRMWQKLRWRKPQGQEWATGTEWGKFKILTTLNGVINYTSLNRANNDRLETVNDPGAGYAQPRYSGIPLERIPTLEDSLTTMSVTNPPYIWLDSRYIFPVYHSEVYMDEGDPIKGGLNQPFSNAVFVNTYEQIFCRSRKRQGWIVGN